jgi:hypothetical protein
MADDSIPTFEPSVITIGETLAWTKALEDYPASEGWALTYYFRGAGVGFDATATADGDEFEISVPATTTANMTAGTYYWQAEVSLSGEKHIVDRGQTEVKAGLAAIDAATTHDGRSVAKTIIDAIDALMLGKATRDQAEYTIGNRSLKRTPVADLILLRERYAQIYAREQRAEKLRQGAPFLKNIYTRFTRPQ